MTGRYAAFLLMLLILFLGPGCTSQLSNGRAGPDPPDAQVAVLDWSGFGATGVSEIDEKKTRGQSRAKLPSGKHTIRYGLGFDYVYDLVATIDMKAGHVYEPRRERFYGSGARRDYLWIEDTTTGEVVAGDLPPHYREKARRSKGATIEREVAEHFSRLSLGAWCGDGRAQYDLGLYYLAGLEPVGRRDLVRAYVWYSLAAANGYPGAGAVMDSVAQEMRPEDRVEAERLRAGTRTKECLREPGDSAVGSGPKPER